MLIKFESSVILYGSQTVTDEQYEAVVFESSAIPYNHQSQENKKSRQTVL